MHLVQTRNGFEHIEQVWVQTGNGLDDLSRETEYLMLLVLRGLRELIFGELPLLQPLGPWGVPV